MDRVVYIFVTGIWDLPGEWCNWTAHAAAWTNLHTGAIGDRYEYFESAATRLFFPWRQYRHARNLAALIQFWAARNCRVRVVAHSHGTWLLLHAMGLIDTPIDEIHLISAACDPDFEVNGINAETLRREVNRVAVYIAEGDRALRWAERTGWQRRCLGRDGPANVADWVVLREVRRQGDHSVWFEGLGEPDAVDTSFGRTMRIVTANAPMRVS